MNEVRASIASQLSTGTLQSSGTTQSEDTREAHGDSSIQNLGWRGLLLLQFQTQFEAVIMFGIYLSYVCALLDVTFAYSAPPDAIPRTYTATGLQFIYVFDVIYILDILLMISYKNLDWAEVQHLYDKRHAVMVLLDIISLVPLDAVYYSLTVASMRIIYTLRLRYTFRIFRFVTTLHSLKNMVGFDSKVIELTECLISFTIALATLSCLTYLIECYPEKCLYADVSFFFKCLYITAGVITTRGYAVTSEGSWTLSMLFLYTNFCAFLYINGFTLGRVLTATLYKYKEQHAFSVTRSLLLKSIAQNGCHDNLLYSASKLYFSLFWKNRRGITFDNLDVKIVPEVMAREISLDIAWDGLKHSHLFRNQEVHFLRYVSPYVKQKFLIPGEVIFKRNHFKSAMVYVVSGVIQILSEQDNETPILFFSAGTCVGESSLFIDYPSTCSVICQGYCEVNVLYRKDFLKVMLKYPEECASMLKDIQERYLDSRHYQDLLRYAHGVEQQKVEILTLKWLKITLNDLMMKNKAARLQYRKTLSLAEKEVIGELDKLTFCAEYLDLLVITEQTELVTDTVFLQTSCPCILQPDSFIVDAWSTIIAFVVLGFALIYPYYACFEPNVSTWYLVFSYVATFLWGLDIYVTMSTAIRTRDGIITDISTIILTNLTNPFIVIDVLAVIPLELFILIITDIHIKTFVLFQALRLLKCHKIKNLFQSASHTFDSRSVTYLKYTVYLFILTYYIAAAWYFTVCPEVDCDFDYIFLLFLRRVSEATSIDALIGFIYLSLQQVTDSGSLIPGIVSAHTQPIFLTCVEIIATLFYIIFLTSATTVETLNRNDRLNLQGFVLSVKTATKNLNVNPEICKQIDRHMRGQLQYNAGVDMLYGIKHLYRDVHPILIKEVRALGFTPVLKRVPLFAELPDKILVELSGSFHIVMLSPGEIIAYSGEVCKEMHVILDGFCKMFEREEETRVVGRGEVLCSTELCFQIPVVNNIVTLTHCKLLTITEDELTQVLRFYPAVLAEIRNTVNDIVETTTLTVFSTKQKFEVHFAQDKRTSRSFKNFGYRLAMDTKEGVDFHAYFDRMGFFGFLRYLFMRHTVTPYGKFIRYWEILRCIFAFATAMISLIIPINTYTSYLWYYIMLFLDITAYIDIYVKHHISYFDARGVEITHPLKTAINYWKHSFIIDILGITPFDVIATSLFDIRDNSLLYFRAFRLFQVYRIIGGIRFLDDELISPPKIWSVVKFVPIIILTVNTLGSMTINFDCHFSESLGASENFSAGVRCISNSWISESKFHKPLSTVRTYLYGVYTTTMVMSAASLGDFNIYSMQEALWIGGVNTVGYLFFICITAKIIAANLYRNVDLTTYQEEMSNLVKFLSYRHIDRNLKRQIIDHFEYVWRESEGKNLFKIISNFHYALQEDVLFDVYGKIMKESAVFEDANTSFFRSLLLKAKCEIIMNRGIICRVNDVHRKIYFLFKGHVEVLGPDYNRLLVLPVGSLFGNIDNCSLSRQTLTMVAKGHVELLSIDSTEFHRILSSYHQLKFSYRTLIIFNTDYLLGGPPPPIDEVASIEVRVATVTSFKSLHLLSAWQKVKPESVAAVWDLVILILVCYFGVTLELYKMVVQEHSTVMVVILYTCDFLYLVHIYLKFQRGYEDEFGIVINDKKKIAVRYLKSSTGFRLDIVTVLPVELFALVFRNIQKRWILWGYCRCNRFIRIFFVLEYFRSRNQQLNINVILTRTISLLAAIVLLLQVFSSLLIILSCSNPSYNASPPLQCTWSNMTALEKYNTYMREFGVVMYITTTTGTEEYCPNSVTLILYFTGIIITGRFLTIVFISEIVATLDTLCHNRVLYEKHIFRLKEHMLRERTSPALAERVWMYVRLLWKRKRGLQFPTLLEEAPYYLREAVLNSMFGYHLRKHELFGKCHVDLIRQMAAQMRPRTFFPGDYITFINDADECMYFIHEGVIDALSEDDMYSEKIDKTLKAGEMFGLEQGMYLHCGHKFTYRAKVHAVILVLQRKDWIHMLHFFPASKVLIYDEQMDVVKRNESKE